MPAQWTGEFIGKLHCNCISAKEFAEYANLNPNYVSTVLNGKRNPKKAEKKFTLALDELIKLKKGRTYDRFKGI